jgi:hypothetical protein
MQSFRNQQEGYTNYAFGYLGPYFEELRQQEKLKSCETGTIKAGDGEEKEYMGELDSYSYACG